MAESIVMQSDLGPAAERKSTFDRLASFRVLYLAIFAFMLLYILSVELAETLLHNYFRVAVKEATRVSPTDGPIVPQIYNQVGRLIHESPWVTVGGVRVQVTVLGADRLTPLYVGSGNVIPLLPAPSLDLAPLECP